MIPAAHHNSPANMNNMCLETAGLYFVIDNIPLFDHATYQRCAFNRSPLQQCHFCYITFHLDCVELSIPNKSYGFLLKLSLNANAIMKIYAINPKTKSN